MGKYIVVKVEADRHGNRTKLIDNRCIGINSFHINFQVSYCTYFFSFQQARLAEQYTVLIHTNIIHSFLVIVLDDHLCSLLELVLYAGTELLVSQRHHLVRLGEDPFSSEPFHQVSFGLDNR